MDAGKYIFLMAVILLVVMLASVSFSSAYSCSNPTKKSPSVESTPDEEDYQFGGRIARVDGSAKNSTVNVTGPPLMNDSVKNLSEALLVIDNITQTTLPHDSLSAATENAGVGDRITGAVSAFPARYGALGVVLGLLLAIILFLILIHLQRNKHWPTEKSFAVKKK